MKLLCGAVLGFGLAFLFDPRSGPERRASTRKRLARLCAAPEPPTDDVTAVDDAAASIAATT